MRRWATARWHDDPVAEPARWNGAVLVDLDFAAGQWPSAVTSAQAAAAGKARIALAAAIGRLPPGWALVADGTTPPSRTTPTPTAWCRG
ncbi:hypothetical protein [Amycolatopsis sp. WQ 127309]|uniref:hypothetical protein n=1 Tax=Amycolatopsis sp. WQ 127309 TaxID=2932773 RepID=UPI001FF4803A|nr:hypothetical protein [Amycolatopsis sp. WQ 127309]UOZ05460.1 hypothetical protein MUY22_42615 [Amycolatopsis sp. WQ 127309]